MSDAWYANLPSLCSSARKVARRYATYQEAWDASTRGDWLLFRAAHAAHLDWDTFVACVIECTKEAGRGTQTPISESPMDIAVAATAPYEHAPLAVKLEIWKRLADVVRSHFPQPPELPK
jgi:hypothetical protein